MVGAQFLFGAFQGLLCKLCTLGIFTLALEPHGFGIGLIDCAYVQPLRVQLALCSKQKD